MIDRFILGIDHLYQKPVYRNMKECNMSKDGQLSEASPSWCYAPFEPEGILSSLTASVALHNWTPIWSYFDRITGP
ncbi:hypothetical protein HanRHA438_Chr15g0703661 [Helianthus annuus]|nr:hypothetical protein HanRHA438_Chr15g0703661 [Helianthus annuus]